MTNDYVWRKVFESFVTILTVSVDIVIVLSFQLVSMFEKLDCKLQSFFIEVLKIP